MTKYEKLQERLQDLKAKRNLLASQLEEANRNAAQALVEGREPEKATNDLHHQVELLDLAIQMAKTELAGAEADHIRHQLAKVEEEREKVRKQREEARSRWEKIRAEYDKAQKEWQQVFDRTEDQDNHLIRQKYALEARLAQLEPTSSQPKATRTVEEWLQDLRDGEIHTIMTGQDANLDEAVKKYEQEQAEIMSWASAADTASRTGVEKPKEPECMRYYSKERVRELIEHDKQRKRMAALTDVPRRSNGSLIPSHQTI